MSWQSYVDDLLGQGDITAAGIYDKEGNPWAYTLTSQDRGPFCAQVAEVAAVTRHLWSCPACNAGEDCVAGEFGPSGYGYNERRGVRRFSPREARRRAATEVGALLAGSHPTTGAPDAALDRLRNTSDVVSLLYDHTLRAALAEVTAAEHAPPHDPAEALGAEGFTLAGERFLYVRGDGPAGEFCARRGAQSVSLHRCRTCVIVAVTSRTAHAAGPAVAAAGRLADHLKAQGI